MLNQIRAPDTKCLELGSIDSALDPLVHGLTGHGRIDELAGLFNAVVVAHLSIAGPVFSTGTADAKARKSISEVHDCQLYHSVQQHAIAFWLIQTMNQADSVTNIPFLCWGSSVRLPREMPDYRLSGSTGEDRTVDGVALFRV